MAHLVFRLMRGQKLTSMPVKPRDCSLLSRKISCKFHEKS